MLPIFVGFRSQNCVTCINPRSI